MVRRVGRACKTLAHDCEGTGHGASEGTARRNDPIPQGAGGARARSPRTGHLAATPSSPAIRDVRVPTKTRAGGARRCPTAIVAAPNHYPGRIRARSVDVLG